MKFGLEIEKFLLKDGAPQVVPIHHAHDDEGFQVEARGEPFSRISDAVYSALGDLHRHRALAEKEGFTLSEAPVMKIPRDQKLAARRVYHKGVISYQNLYGHKRHSVAQSESTAGIHLSVTSPHEIFFEKRVGDHNESGKLVYNSLWDFATFFRALDEEFKGEIKAAKRKPGFYEIKVDGRIEYRSLPTNVDLSKLIKFVEEWRF